MSVSSPRQSCSPGTTVERRPSSSLWHWIVLFHRWLGGLFLLAVVAWFVSGIVMLWVRMPALDPHERLQRLPPLDPATIRIAPSEALRSTGGSADRLRLSTALGRPAYRLLDRGRWTTVFADDGATFDGFDRSTALFEAARHPGCAAGASKSDRPVERLVELDQWTLQSGALRPLWRVACGGTDATVVYLSDALGEVVLATDRRSRVWAHFGPVLHWWYWPALRRDGGVWLQVVLWASLTVWLVSLLGLAIGLRAHRRARRHGRAVYRGAIRWHQLLGLSAGWLTSAWLLSGALSLEPWGWPRSSAASLQQERAFSGGPLRLRGITVGQIRAALDGLDRPREIELLRALGSDGEARSDLSSRQILALAYEPSPLSPADAPGASVPLDRRGPNAFLSLWQRIERRLWDVERSAPNRLDDGALERAANAAMPGHRLVRSERLTEYDAYYGSSNRVAPLPAVRYVYDDPRRTWLVVDPATARIVRRDDSTTRAYRWLYRALHSWDLSAFGDRGPVWRVAIVLGLLAGLTLAVTPLPSLMRRLRRRREQSPTA